MLQDEDMLGDEVEEKNPFLHVRIEQRESDEESRNLRNLEFYWNMTKFEKYEAIIQCHFDESVYVSSGTEPDHLIITFVDTSLFFDFAGQQIESGTTLSRQLPP